MADADADLERQVRVYELLGPLTVVTGRVQLMRRRLRRGELDAARVAADLEAMEGALVRLTVAIERAEADERRTD